MCYLHQLISGERHGFISVLDREFEDAGWRGSRYRSSAHFIRILPVFISAALKISFQQGYRLRMCSPGYFCLSYDLGKRNCMIAVAVRIDTQISDAKICNVHAAHHRANMTIQDPSTRIPNPRSMGGPSYRSCSCLSGPLQYNAKDLPWWAT